MSKKETAHDILMQNRGNVLALGKKLFSCPEPGFREEKTQKIITSFLREENIPYNDGIALTGVKASLGNKGGYHIVLAADMDAYLVRDGEQIVPFHSCGHSIQVAVMLSALMILKRGGILDGTDVKVSFIATPAEEYIDLAYRKALIDQGLIRFPSGKQNMIAQGLFDDVDCVISAHISGDDSTLFDVQSSLTGFMVKKAVFTGKASHSGAAPYLGRNALHGATLAMNALSFLKDQFPPQSNVQIHPILTEGGTEMNVIPDRAVLETYIRASTQEALFEAAAKFDTCVEHCAKILELESTVQTSPGYLPFQQSGELSSLIHRNMLTICGEENIQKNVSSGASGDVGDLGFLLPCVQFGFSGMRGRIHSNQFEITDEDHVYLHTAQIVLDTIIDLIEHPGERVRSSDYKEKKAFYLSHWLFQ